MSDLLLVSEYRNSTWKDNVWKKERYIYGKKNSVYFNNVSSVEKVKINLTTRGMEKEFYIFNDGRKNNANIFNINSCYNNKKFKTNN